MSEDEKNKRRKDGRLKHCCGNMSLFCFSLSFIERMVSTEQTLPLHKAWKRAQYVDDKGLPHLSSEPIAWKFETFIFDWLKHTKKIAALLYPREQCFAPLKNLKGNNSPDSVRKALLEMDKKTIQKLNELPPPNFPFELAADFHYPTDDLKAKWKGRAITTPYVDP